MGARIWILSLLFTASAAQAYEKVSLKYSEQFILETIAAHMMQKPLDPALPLPPVHLQAETPLEDFQNAIFPQWGFKPDKFTNAFIIATDHIFLMDEKSYYERLHRTIDDSLAHELAHYIQKTYLGYDLYNDESAEPIAIDVQTWFRETYMQ